MSGLKNMNSYSKLLNDAALEVNNFISKSKLKSNKAWYEDFQRRIQNGAKCKSDEKAEKALDALGWIWVESDEGVELAPSLDKALGLKKENIRQRFIEQHKKK